jgi:hypothetical protein
MSRMPDLAQVELHPLDCLQGWYYELCQDGAPEDLESDSAESAVPASIATIPIYGYVPWLYPEFRRTLLKCTGNGRWRHEYGGAAREYLDSRGFLRSVAEGGYDGSALAAEYKSVFSKCR